jgi:ubiquitin C-terminal hydrolase
LKRFEWTPTSRGAKINTDVKFQLEKLDLAPFCKESEEVDTCYKLMSVVMHHGISLQSGHYTCYAYNTESDAWIHFNDSRVTIAEEEDVTESEAYMLFYQRSYEVSTKLMFEDDKFKNKL